MAEAGFSRSLPTMKCYGLYPKFVTFSIDPEVRPVELNEGLVPGTGVLA